MKFPSQPAVSWFKLYPNHMVDENGKIGKASSLQKGNKRIYE